MRKNKSKKNAYEEILGKNNKVADLIQLAHRTLIAAGTELEHLVFDSCKNKITDIDEFIENYEGYEKGVWVADKKTYKTGTGFKSEEEKPHEPDFLIFDLNVPAKCYVVELKDGFLMDTKKSESEYGALVKYIEMLAKKGLEFILTPLISCFRGTSHEEIYLGLKKKFPIQNILTGRELCDLIGADYDGICKARADDQEQNRKWMYEQLADIPEIQKLVLEKEKKEEGR